MSEDEKLAHDSVSKIFSNRLNCEKRLKEINELVARGIEWAYDSELYDIMIEILELSKID